MSIIKMADMKFDVEIVVANPFVTPLLNDTLRSLFKRSKISVIRVWAYLIVSIVSKL